MPKFSANLSMLFTEKPLLDRFQAAADAGFASVEMQFPYDQTAQALKDSADAAGVKIVLINVPAGDLMQGGQGLAGIPGKEAEYHQALEQCIDYAKVLQPACINVLAGREEDKSRHAECHRTFISNLRHTAETLDAIGIMTVFEAVNKYDMPGFLVDNTRQQLTILEEIQHPNLRLQYDIYHMQREEGSLVETIISQAAYIGHIQFADAPGRGQPGTGEIDFKSVFDAIDHAGYNGYVGAEYIPQGNTEESLAWLARD